MKILKTTKLNKLPLVLALFATLTLITSSCTEDEGDITNPDVVISSPSEGDSFTSNQIVEIVGRATDDVALQNLNISSNLGLNEDLREFEDPTDFPFNINVTLQEDTPPGEYTITLTATDTSGNTDEQEVNIQIQ